MSFIDLVINEVDKGLKYSTQNYQTEKRPYPAEKAEQESLNEFEKNHSAGLMRVNHSGEVCAQALYRGQALTAKLVDTKDKMEQAASEELDHLSWCNKRLEESEAFIQSIIERPNLTFLILDGLLDPHNVGACLRSAAAADVDAVIVPKDRSCHLTPTVRKISCGASELIPFVIVTNIVRTINNLQEMGVAVYGSDLKASLGHNEINYPKKMALIIGSENKGIRRLTRENCDELIKIKMSEKMDSLNASVSAGIMLFEIKKQNNSFN